MPTSAWAWFRMPPMPTQTWAWHPPHHPIAGAKTKPRKFWAGLFVATTCLLPLAGAGEKGKFSVKTGDSAPPKELAEPIRKVLSNESVQFVDGSGKAIAEIWLRNGIPTDATPEQIKNGATWREIKQSEVLGAIRFERNWTDYRKQPIKAGVYTMRLAFQPADGKHGADVSEFQEFVVLLSPKTDTSPNLMEPKKLQESSSDAIDSGHPGVFMLVPTKPGKTAEAVARPKEHWMLATKAPLSAGGKTGGAFIGIGINLVGHSPAE